MASDPCIHTDTGGCSRQPTCNIDPHRHSLFLLFSTLPATLAKLDLLCPRFFSYFIFSLVEFFPFLSTTSSSSSTDRLIPVAPFFFDFFARPNLVVPWLLLECLLYHRFLLLLQRLLYRYCFLFPSQKARQFCVRLCEGSGLVVLLL